MSNTNDWSGRSLMDSARKILQWVELLDLRDLEFSSSRITSVESGHYECWVSEPWRKFLNSFPHLVFYKTDSCYPYFMVSITTRSYLSYRFIMSLYNKNHKKWTIHKYQHFKHVFKKKLWVIIILITFKLIDEIQIIMVVINEHE